MDTILTTQAFSQVETILIVSAVLFVAALFYTSQRRIRRLEAKLAQTQSMLAREIKMVNQGAIGIGRRFAQVEKKINHSSNNVATFKAKETKTPSSQLYHASKFAEIQAQAKQAAKVKIDKPKPVKVATQGLTTKAEQSLTAWLKENQTA
jgi:hypothetical protein